MDPARQPVLKPRILFDGVCNLCASSVRFVIARDPKAHFLFAALQSPAGQRELARVAPGRTWPDSLVLIDGDRAFTESSAALRIARRLRFPWPLLAVFLLVPAFLRDPVYRFVARRRYRWFGKQETCMVPTPALRARFLDAGDTSGS